MKTLEIENVKQFTSALFAGTSFDNFFITEASFSTLFNVKIDGHINSEFLDKEEKNSPTAEAVVWGRIRPLCYDIIKGKKVPLKFKIVFMMPDRIKEQLATKEHLNTENIEALFLNVTFEKNRLYITSGISLRGFYLDKTAQEAWDKMAAELLKGF